MIQETKDIDALEEENAELREMLAGAQLTEKNLEDYLYEICDIIHMQMSLRTQDRWLERMMELGLYDPNEGLEAYDGN
jgi:transcriptional/translational regulatory protein YebC/TACO1